MNGDERIQRLTLPGLTVHGRRSIFLDTTLAGENILTDHACSTRRPARWSLVDQSRMKTDVDGCFWLSVDGKRLIAQS